jgi:hypothetical protein
MKKRKNLDLTIECIKTLSKRAIDENTDFKNLAQNILEKESEKITFKNIPV